MKKIDTEPASSIEPEPTDETVSDTGETTQDKELSSLEISDLRGDIYEAIDAKDIDKVIESTVKARVLINRSAKTGQDLSKLRAAVSRGIDTLSAEDKVRYYEELDRSLD